MSLSTILDDLAYEHAERAQEETLYHAGWRSSLHQSLAFCQCPLAVDYRLVKNRRKLYESLKEVYGGYEAVCLAGRGGVSPAQGVPAREKAKLLIRIIEGGA